MWTDQVLLRLSNETEYRREELFRAFREEKQDLSEASFRWIIYNLMQAHKLFKTDHNTYVTEMPQMLPVYRPFYSDEAKELMGKIEGQFPALDFVMFESVLLNEFLNHQIAQNTMYVQVEKEVSAFIFDFLQQEYTGSVLYKPGQAEFDRYWTRGCIVVLNLISQAPLSHESPHKMTAEKMLVDIIADKSIAATFSPSELPFVYENVMKNYRVDKLKMNRYAGRRGKAPKIMDYMRGLE